MALGYSVQPDPDKTAKALGRELELKPRHAIEVARFVRGHDTKKAKDLLRSVLLGAGERPRLPEDDKEEAERILGLPRRAVPFRRHVGSKGHRKGKVGPGGYPVKTVTAFLKLIEQAESNAEYKGLDPEKLFVQHAAAQRARVVRGMMPGPRGSGKPWNKSLTHIEIVVAEKEEA